MRSLDSANSIDPDYRPWLHRVALLTAVATFPLIFMGGLVTSHQAGMSVPDWPNSYGYNMFLFPPRLWVGGILYEHVHRLMASVVGMCAIGLTVFAWLVEPRKWARWIATAVLGMVIFQGVLGGLRVVLVKLDLAIVHACVAQAFFCLATFEAIVTSKWWFSSPSTEHRRGFAVEMGEERSDDSNFVSYARPFLKHQKSGIDGFRLVLNVSVACVLIVYAQLIVAATMRHFGAGLAIPDIPFAYGRWLPPVSAAQLQADNQIRVWQWHLDPVTLGQVWLAYTHRIGAIVVTLAITTLVAVIIRSRRMLRDLLVPAGVLATLLLTQVTLGLLTVYFRKPADVASAHVACGALVLVTTFVIATRAGRLYHLQSGTGVPHVLNKISLPKSKLREDRYASIHVRDARAT